MGLLRYEKNEKQRILEMHKRATRPLYENFSDDAMFDDELDMDIMDAPEMSDDNEIGGMDKFRSDYPELAEKYFGSDKIDTEMSMDTEEVFEGDDEKEKSPKADMDEGKDAPYGESKGASEASKGKNTPFKGK